MDKAKTIQNRNIIIITSKESRLYSSIPADRNHGFYPASEFVKKIGLLYYFMAKETYFQRKNPARFLCKNHQASFCTQCTFGSSQRAARLSGIRRVASLAAEQLVLALHTPAAALSGSRALSPRIRAYDRGAQPWVPPTVYTRHRASVCESSIEIEDA